MTAARIVTCADAQSILEQLAGSSAVLREDQWTAIEALVVERRRALVVQRTGWGKSAVYFIAALLVDDLIDTGWTMTTAARVVRAAGAPAVLPFALAGTS